MPAGELIEAQPIVTLGSNPGDQPQVDCRESSLEFFSDPFQKADPFCLINATSHESLSDSIYQIPVRKCIGEVGLKRDLKGRGDPCRRRKFLGAAFGTSCGPSDLHETF